MEEDEAEGEDRGVKGLLGSGGGDVGEVGERMDVDDELCESSSVTDQLVSQRDTQ